MRMVEEVDAAVGMNRFWLPTEDVTKIGGNPLAGYVKMLYDLTAQQALVIECEIPQVRHWSCNSLIFSTRPSTTVPSIVHQQPAALIDADGKVRIVLSAVTWVPNWVDTRFPAGVCPMALVPERPVPVPATKLVPVAEVREHLPPATPSYHRNSGPAAR